ncbi:MAG: ribonuclease E, partial [Alphaproteobacteria bacterium]|nr:ribonuclease E [Alphaproteobacteria bacterium]
MDILIEELEGSLWAAALKNGRLEGLEVDPPYEEIRWGSIYWAKVKTIDKALDAVFVDLDGDNTGIL